MEYIAEPIDSELSSKDRSSKGGLKLCHLDDYSMGGSVLLEYRSFDFYLNGTATDGEIL